MKRQGPRHLAAALIGSAVFAVLVLMAVPLRMDMAGLLPAGHDDASRFLLREVESGIAGTVLSVGVENAPEPELARLSLGLRDALSHDPHFVTAVNGAFSATQSETLRMMLFRGRYLISPDDATRDFSPPALKGDFTRLIDALNTDVGEAMSDLMLRDPSFALNATLQTLSPDGHAALRRGVWFSADQAHPRALLLVRTRAPGMDFGRQTEAQAAIHAAFEALKPGSARLLMSGPAVFALDSASSTRRDVDRISVVSLGIVVAVLWWRFRSLWVLAAIGVPFLLSLGLAMIVVRLIFGSVHGIAFGFGMTMLGISLDYPVLLLGHRDRGEGPGATLRRIGESLRIGVVTATLGLAGMVFCGLPALEQLGTFAAVGLITAALVTLYLMPHLIVAADLAPHVCGPSPPLHRAERLRRWRWACAVPILASIGALMVRPLMFDGRLSSLSPIPKAAQELDAQFRRDLGIPDASLLIAVSGHDAEAVLEREESLAPILARIQAEGALSKVQEATHLVPSAALQRQRAQSLPDDSTLAADISAGSVGLPFQPGAFAGFTADIAASRHLPPVTPEEIGRTPLAAGLAPLLFKRGDLWWGLILPEEVRDRAAVTRAFAGGSGADAAGGLVGGGGRIDGDVAGGLVRGADAGSMSGGKMNDGAADRMSNASGPLSGPMPDRISDAKGGIPGVLVLDIHSALDGLSAAYTGRTLRWMGAGCALALLVLAWGLRDLRRVGRVLASVAASLVTLLGIVAAFGAPLTLIHLIALQFVVGVSLDYALFFARPQLDDVERARTMRTLLTCNIMTVLTFGSLALCHTVILRHIGMIVAPGVFLAMVFSFLLAGPRNGAEKAGVS